MRCKRVKPPYLLAVILCSFLLGLGSTSVQAQKKGKEKGTDKNGLSKTYSEWLNREVVYIITKSERKTFLELPTDDERDKFIQRFWDIRNPDPGSPENTYKDEIYRRISYANAHFGVGEGQEGWSTDRGRTYITLGAPQQIRKYYGAPNLYPMEIWFYSSTNPSLPSFFYVVFYEPDNQGAFRYYSPLMDGPDKLVTGTEAVNDPQAALHMITSSVGPEVARVAQTLLPGEPLDPNGYISMQSDILLGTIKNLANTPWNLDELDRRRQMTNVTAQLIVDATNRLDTVLFPVRDARGLTRLDYALRLRNPSDLTLTQTEDGHYTYALEVRVRVLTPDNKLIFAQQKSVSGTIDHHRLEEIQEHPFGYEGMLPLPPGKYHLDFVLTDWTKHVGFHAERNAEIPEGAASTLSIPALLPFSDAKPIDPTKDGSTPFAMAGLKFTPLGAARPILNPGMNLNVAYQVWAEPRDPRQIAGQKLDIEYALGQPSVATVTTSLKDSADMGEFTATGTLVSGKKIPLTGSSEGSYLLTVSVNHTGTSEKAFSTLSLQILGDVPAELPWYMDQPDIESDLAKGIFDQDRALCYLAENNANEARRWFRVALSKDHGDDIARAHLVEAYYGLNAYPAVVSLFNDAGITDQTDAGTITQIAESFLKVGNSTKALSLLQDALRAAPDNGPLYLALADCYQAMGKQQEALEMSRKGHSLMTSAPTQQ